MLEKCDFVFFHLNCIYTVSTLKLYLYLIQEHAKSANSMYSCMQETMKYLFILSYLVICITVNSLDI